MVPLAKIPGVFAALMQGTRVPALRHALLYRVLSAGRHDDLWAQWIAAFHADRTVRKQVIGLVRQVDTDELLAATDGLAEWGGDAVVAWGMADKIFRPELGRRLATTLDCPFVEIPDAKTYVPLDAPAELADVVSEFAARPLAAG